MQGSTTDRVRSPRVKPSITAGLFLYVGYLAIFFTTWKINDVDYPSIGDSLESTKLHYAYPTLFGCAFLVVAITVMGWWRLTMFDRVTSGPRWAWIGPIAMLLLSVASFTTADLTDGASTELVLFSVLGGIGVGFGEEMITRGGLLVGLRSSGSENRAWLWSTVAFAALHAPNAFFGQRLGATVVQLVLTFIVGSLLYAARRLSGTLLLPIFLHGFWDSSIFLPKATGADPFVPAVLIYPISIAVIVGVLRYQRRNAIVVGTSVQ